MPAIIIDCVVTACVVYAEERLFHGEVLQRVRAS